MDKDIHVVQEHDGAGATASQAPGTDHRLGELFKQLGHDSTTLLKQEIALAKTEMRDNMKAMGKDAAFLAVGGGVLLVGTLVLTTFLVLLIGAALDNYWLAALIVGAVYTLAGVGLLMKGKNNLQHDEMKPDQTIATLKEDKTWAQSEVQQVKRGLSTPNQGAR